jgi:hypothetical protein
MSTKFLYVGQPGKREKREKHGGLLWTAQLLVVLATLAVVGLAYGVWHILQTGIPSPELPDNTTLPMPGP